MDENKFWHCCPRKFFALLRAHRIYTKQEKEDEAPKIAFIDEILP
jgi:hypothetical protein